MSRAEFKQGLKRKYERLKEKQLIAIILVPSYQEKQKKSTGSIKKLRNQNGSRQELIKAMHKPLFFQL